MLNDDGFDGAKVALLLGDQLVTILRDNIPGLAFAGCWDLPGGGREGRESPFECLSRECAEELGLWLKPKYILWRRGFEGPKGTQWFFLARLPLDMVEQVVFGDEGQCWKLMCVQGYILHTNAIPRLQERLRIAVSEGLEKRKPPAFLSGGR